MIHAPFLITRHKDVPPSKAPACYFHQDVNHRECNCMSDLVWCVLRATLRSSDWESFRNSEVIPDYTVGVRPMLAGIFPRSAGLLRLRVSAAPSATRGTSVPRKTR